MSPVRIPLRVVLYREEGAWIAHCLELDLLGDGQTKDDAMRHLGQAVFTQIQATIKYKNPSNLFKPADGRYFQMFAEGRKLGNAAIAEMRIELNAPSESVEIEELEAREYDDNIPDGSDYLVPA